MSSSLWITKPFLQPSSSSKYEDVAFVSSILFPSLASHLQPFYAVMIEKTHPNQETSLVLAIRVPDIVTEESQETNSIPMRFFFFDVYVRPSSSSSSSPSSGQIQEYHLLLKQEWIHGPWTKYASFRHLLKHGIHRILFGDSVRKKLKYVPSLSIKRFVEQGGMPESERLIGLLSSKKRDKYIQSVSFPLCMDLLLRMYTEAEKQLILSPAAAAAANTTSLSVESWEDQWTKVTEPWTQWIRPNIGKTSSLVFSSKEWAMDQGRLGTKEINIEQVLECLDHPFQELEKDKKTEKELSISPFTLRTWEKEYKQLQTESNQQRKLIQRLQVEKELLQEQILQPQTEIKTLKENAIKVEKVLQKSVDEWKQKSLTAETQVNQLTKQLQHQETETQELVQAKAKITQYEKELTQANNTRLEQELRKVLTLKQEEEKQSKTQTEIKELKQQLQQKEDETKGLANALSALQTVEERLKQEMVETKTKNAQYTKELTQAKANNARCEQELEKVRTSKQEEEKRLPATQAEIKELKQQLQQKEANNLLALQTLEDLLKQAKTRITQYEEELTQANATNAQCKKELEKVRTSKQEKEKQVQTLQEEIKKTRNMQQTTAQEKDAMKKKLDETMVSKQELENLLRQCQIEANIQSQEAQKRWKEELTQANATNAQCKKELEKVRTSKQEKEKQVQTLQEEIKKTRNMQQTTAQEKDAMKKKLDETMVSKQELENRLRQCQIEANIQSQEAQKRWKEEKQSQDQEENPESERFLQGVKNIVSDLYQNIMGATDVSWFKDLSMEAMQTIGNALWNKVQEERIQYFTRLNEIYVAVQPINTAPVQDINLVFDIILSQLNEWKSVQKARDKNLSVIASVLGDPLENENENENENEADKIDFIGRKVNTWSTELEQFRLLKENVHTAVAASLEENKSQEDLMKEVRTYEKEFKSEEEWFQNIHSWILSVRYLLSNLPLSSTLLFNSAMVEENGDIMMKDTPFEFRSRRTLIGQALAAESKISEKWSKMYTFLQDTRDELLWWQSFSTALRSLDFFSLFRMEHKDEKEQLLNLVEYLKGTHRDLMFLWNIPVEEQPRVDLKKGFQSFQREEIGKFTLLVPENNRLAPNYVTFENVRQLLNDYIQQLQPVQEPRKKRNIQVRSTLFAVSSSFLVVFPETKRTTQPIPFETLHLVHIWKSLSGMEFEEYWIIDLLVGFVYVHQEWQTISSRLFPTVVDAIQGCTQEIQQRFPGISVQPLKRVPFNTLLTRPFHPTRSSCHWSWNQVFQQLLFSSMQRRAIVIPLPAQGRYMILFGGPPSVLTSRRTVVETEDADRLNFAATYGTPKGFVVYSRIFDVIEQTYPLQQTHYLFHSAKAFNRQWCLSTGNEKTKTPLPETRLTFQPELLRSFCIPLVSSSHSLSYEDETRWGISLELDKTKSNHSHWSTNSWSIVLKRLGVSMFSMEDM